MPHAQNQRRRASSAATVLRPVQKLWHHNIYSSPLTKAERSAQLGLSDCIECTLCDQVCPSELPLTETFKRMKANQQRLQQTTAVAEATEQRFLKRESRIQALAATVVVRPKPKDALALIAQLKGGAES